MIFAAGLIVAVTGASALSLDGLSIPCAAAITGVSIDPAFTCLGVSDLRNVVFALANQSFIASVDSWVTSTCAQPACPNVTVDSLFTQITTGCATDLSNIGVTPIVIEDIRGYDKDLYQLGRAYPLIRPFLGFFELIAADISLGLLCGANFFNVTRPAGVVQSANTASPVPGATANSTTSVTASTTTSATANSAVNQKTGVFGAAAAIVLAIAGAITLAS
ncbi:hypothetical protein BDV93DRAFT_560622 [Ceratobasidium sp. AG-I]|nr:hypothetical protein BDV93DRAFT_560622 [Ceratobasidium sp. AG-I]